MKTVRGVTLLVVCWLAYTSSGLVQAGESPYKTKVEYKDTEDDVQILDKDDKLVASVVIFDEGYEVEKPAGSDVCLVRFLEDDDDCFDESPVEDGVPDAVQKFCEGKEIRLLKPVACYDDEEDNEEPEKPGRKKRFLGRIVRKIKDKVNNIKDKVCKFVSRTCNRVCGSRCCLSVFGRCIRSCKKFCPYDCFKKICG